MIQVVRRNPRERRIPVKYAQPSGIKGIELAALEHRTMVMVVTEYPRAKAEIEAEREHPGNHARLDVRREAYGGK
jgi:hypothetical protein